MATSMYTTSVCLLVLIISCTCRPSEVELFSENEINDTSNVDELDEPSQIERRDDTSSTTSQVTENTPARLTNSRISPQQINELKAQLRFVNKLSLEEFQTICANMQPAQVQKLRSSVLWIAEKTGSKELLPIGQSTATTLSSQEIQQLRKFEQSLFQNFNSATKSQLSRRGTNQMLSGMKSQLEYELRVIKKLSTLIGKQVSSSSQLSESEIKEITDRVDEIRKLSTDLQSQLQRVKDISQLSQISDKFLDIQTLSAEIQQKISAEVLEKKLEEINSSSAQDDSDTSSSSLNTSDSNNLETRDVSSSATENTTTIQKQTKPKFVKDFEKFFNGIRSFFEMFLNQANNLNRSDQQFNIIPQNILSAILTIQRIYVAGSQALNRT